MRQVECPTCARACDRNGVLVHRMKKLVGKLHLLHHGEPPQSWLCTHPDCKAAWEAIDRG